VTGEFGQSRSRIIVHVIRNVERVHAIDADEKHMLDVARLCGGGCGKQACNNQRCQRSGEKATNGHGKPPEKNRTERED
jgi:hypothetical protein